MLLIAIGYGASSIAGPDEDGTLSFAITLPLSRRSVLLQKVLTLAFQVAGLALLTMLCAVVGRSFELPVSLAHLAGISIGVALLGLDFGLLALAVGVWSGSRGLALGVAAGLAAISYLVDSLAPVISWMRPARYASLFYWAVGNGELERGLSAASAGVLLIVAAVLLLVAVVRFERLDLH
jgi:ABC-2 type transport system permease protein